MAKNGNLNKEDINEELRLINDTNDYYVSNCGNVYKLTNNNKYLKLKPSMMHRGYYQVAVIEKSGKKVTKRLNRLVAIHFIDNPDNLPVVGHKNNIKTDNRVENLYWTTYSENTQKAVDDGILVNDIGYEDSQSHPVIVYDKDMKEIDRVGSMSLCAKKYNVSKSTVARHCNNEIKGKTRCGYYFRYDEEINK
jgi:hypothetical protein